MMSSNENQVLRSSVWEVRLSKCGEYYFKHVSTSLTEFPCDTSRRFI